jgi:hypothetical protein
MAKERKESLADVDGFIREALRSFPRLMLEQLLAQKLKSMDLKVPADSIRKLAELAMKDGKGSLHVDGIPDNTVLTITDEESRRIVSKTKEFHENNLTSLLDKFVDTGTERLLHDLVERWPEENAAQKEEVRGFNDRLEKRWGRGLGLLRLLLTITREWAEESEQRNRKKRSHLRSVLLRLHVRACQVANEIIVLLEHGFADGAMARWRTLHEIATVGAVIAKHGEDIAERYVHYQIVESYRALKAYERDHKELKFKPASKAETQRVQKKYDEAIARFGKPFGKEYGWAAQHLRKSEGDKLNFARLEAEIDSAYMRSPYKMASYNVHASPKGAYFRLGNIDGSPVMLAGATNAGLTEPAQHTAISLAEFTLVVIGDSDRMTDILMGNVIRRIETMIPREFWKAEQKLRRDERRIRRSVKKK